jgi:hypothetical protein
LKDNRIVGTELYDEVNDGNETKNVAALTEHAGIVAALSKFLPPPIAAGPQGVPDKPQKESKKGKKGGKLESELKGTNKPRDSAPNAA